MNKENAAGRHILVWGINYAPEETGIGPYNTDVCAYLREAGCKVSMVTAFPYYPHWRKRPEDRGQFFRTELDQGVDVYRCGLYVPSRPTALRRIIHEASFAVMSFFRALLLPRPSAILVVSPPLVLGPAARLLSLLKRAPYFLHVQDMQPDAAVQMGFLRPGLLTKILYRLEAIAYGGATRVSGITSGMIQLFREKGVPSDRTVLFPNWEIPARQSAHPIQSEIPSFRWRHGISQETFLVGYSGNLGKKQGLSILLDAARALRDTSPQTQIIIAGDGGEKASLEERIRREDLPNVRLFPLLTSAEYQAFLRETDICVVTQQPGSGALFFPSKLLRILSAKKPVLAVADETSELHAAVRDGGFGVSVPAANATALADAVRELAEDPDKLASLASRGPAWLSRFDRRKVLNEFFQRLVASSARENEGKSAAFDPAEIPEESVDNCRTVDPIKNR